MESKIPQVAWDVDKDMALSRSISQLSSKELKERGRHYLAGPWKYPNGDLIEFIVKKERVMSWFRFMITWPLDVGYCILMSILVFGFMIPLFQTISSRAYEGSLFSDGHYHCESPFDEDLVYTLLGLVVVAWVDYILAVLVFATVHVTYAFNLFCLTLFCSVAIWNRHWPCHYSFPTVFANLCFGTSVSHWISRICMCNEYICRFWMWIFSCMVFEIQGLIVFLKRNAKMIKAKIAMTREKYRRRRNAKKVFDESQEVMTLDEKAEKALRDGSLKLLSGRRLIKSCYKKLVPIRSRQEFEREDPGIFLSNEEAVRCFKKHCGIIAISYPWITAAHPDPEMHHLKTALQIIPYYLMYGWFSLTFDVGIFWDFASLPQGERTPEEQRQFREGLKSINTLYGSPRVLVIQLKDMPTEVDGKATDETLRNKYDISGWCTFEAEVSRMVKEPNMVLDERRIRDVRIAVYSLRSKIGKWLFRSPWVDLIMHIICYQLLSAAIYTESYNGIVGIGFIFSVEMVIRSLLPLVCEKSQRIYPFKSLIFAWNLKLLTILLTHIGAARNQIMGDDKSPFYCWSVFIVFQFRFVYLMDGLCSFTRPEFEILSANEQAYQPPLHPDEFEELLKEKKFTNGADSSFVVEKYKQFFYAVANTTSSLDFARQSVSPGTQGTMTWTEFDAIKVARVLELFHRNAAKNSDAPFNPLTHLTLDFRFLGNRGAIEIIGALPAELVSLSLHGCGFGEEVLNVLADALENEKEHAQLKEFRLPAYLACSPAAERIEKLRGNWKNLWGVHFWGYQPYFCSLWWNVASIRLCGYKFCL